MESLKETLIKQVDLIKENQNLRLEKLKQNEEQELKSIENIKLQIKNLENDISDLQSKIYSLEKESLIEDKDKLIEYEYKKNENILLNNNKIKELGKEIKLFENKKDLLEKYYSKGLEKFNEKLKKQQEIIDKNDTNKINSIQNLKQKFEEMKINKTENYNELIENKKELDEKIKHLQNIIIYEKQDNLRTRFQNINTLMKSNLYHKNLKEKEKNLECEIKKSKYNLKSFEDNEYNLEKEKILLGLKNDLLQNELDLKCNNISNDKYFLNSKEINTKYEKELIGLEVKKNTLIKYDNKINSEYFKFKHNKLSNSKKLGNEIKKSNSKFELIKLYQKELKKINYKLNEYNVICINIDNLYEIELDKINEEYNRIYFLEKVNYDNILKEIDDYNDDKNLKIEKILNEINTLKNKISYFEYNNHNLETLYELKIKNYTENNDNNKINMENYKNDIEGKKLLLVSKKERYQEFTDNYNINKLKKETESNNLLIEELYKIQELEKKINEL